MVVCACCCRGLTSDAKGDYLGSVVLQGFDYGFAPGLMFHLVSYTDLIKRIERKACRAMMRRTTYQPTGEMRSFYAIWQIWLSKESMDLLPFSCRAISHVDWVLLEHLNEALLAFADKGFWNVLPVHIKDTEMDKFAKFKARAKAIHKWY